MNKFIYPLFQLIWMKKNIKLYSAIRKQIIPVLLSITLLSAILPIRPLTVSADPGLSVYIIGGQNNSWRTEEVETLTFISNASLSDFIGVLINGKLIDRQNYDVAEGSIIVTLKADYLASLPAGVYTIGIKSTSGITTAEFTIQAKEDNQDSKPGYRNMLQTGDNANILLLLALMIVAGSVLAVFGIKAEKEE